MGDVLSLAGLHHLISLGWILATPSLPQYRQNQIKRRPSSERSIRKREPRSCPPEGENSHVFANTFFQDFFAVVAIGPPSRTRQERVRHRAYTGDLLTFLEIPWRNTRLKNRAGSPVHRHRTMRISADLSRLNVQRSSLRAKLI